MMEFVVALVSLLVTCYVPGYLLGWALFKKGDLEGQERNLLSFALSVMLVGGFMSLLATFTTFEMWKTLAFVLAVSVVSLLVYHRREGGLPPMPRFELPRCGLVAVVIGAFVALSFYHALLFPETSWDGLAYHLDVSETFYEKGYAPTTGYNFINLPNGMHFVYAWFYQWNGFNDLFARLMSPLFGLAMLCLTYSFARRLFGSEVARFSALLLAAIPLFVAQSQVVYLNLAETFFSFFSLYLVWMFMKRGGLRYAAVAGLLGGFAAAVKLSALFLWPAIAAILIYHYRKKLSDALAPLAVYTAAFAAVAAPWYLRNLLVFANPAYPYNLLFFKGAIPPANQPLAQGVSWLVFDHKITYSFGNGPLLLTFGLAGLLLCRKLKEARFLYLYFFITLAAILAFLRIDGRFFFELYPPLAIFGAMAFVRLNASRGLARRLACLVLALEVLFGLAFAVVGFKMQEAYSDRMSLTLPVPMPFDRALELRFGGIWGAWSYIDKNAARGDAVAVAAATRPYYYHRDTYIFTETDVGNQITKAQLSDDLSAAVSYLKSLGVRYVYDERRAYHGAYEPVDNVVMNNINDSRYFKEVFNSEWASVYEIL